MQGLEQNLYYRNAASKLHRAARSIRDACQPAPEIRFKKSRPLKHRFYSKSQRFARFSGLRRLRLSRSALSLANAALDAQLAKELSCLLEEARLLSWEQKKGLKGSGEPTASGWLHSSLQAACTARSAAQGKLHAGTMSTGIGGICWPQ